MVKNKIAPPFRKVEFDILFNRGINQTAELLDMGVDNGVLRRSGTWVSYGDIRLGQGRERSREFLDENTEVRERLREEILEKLMPDEDSDEEAKAPKAEAGSEKVAAGCACERAAAVGTPRPIRRHGSRPASPWQRSRQEPEGEVASVRRGRPLSPLALAHR